MKLIVSFIKRTTAMFRRHEELLPYPSIGNSDVPSP